MLRVLRSFELSTVPGTCRFGEEDFYHRVDDMDDTCMLIWHLARTVLDLRNHPQTALTDNFT